MVGVLAAFGAGIWSAGNADINTVYVEIIACIFYLCISKMICKTITERKKLAFLLLWFIAGLLRMEYAREPEPGSIVEFIGQTVEFHGTIAGVPRVVAGADGKWTARYAVDIESIGPNESHLKPYTHGGGAFLSVKQATANVRGVAGDEIAAVGKVRMIHNYHNPGQSNWAEILSVQGISARVTARPGTLKITERASLLSGLARWRSQVRDEMLQAMPEGDASLINGMLFGGYTGVDRRIVRDFSTTGIVHILSVSGAHIALVAAAIFWFTRRLSVNQAWSALFAGAIMIVYGYISGYSPPVVRSVVMGLCAMAAIGSGRISYASHALSVAVLGMLIWEPRYLLDISFQLSVGCTAGLLYLGSPMICLCSECLDGVLPNGVAKWIIAAISATMAAQLAVLPFLAWYFGTFPIVSLLANLIVAPILESVILIGLFGAVLCGGFPEITRILFAGISLMTGMAVEINRLFARLPEGSMALPAWNPGSACLYYYLLGWWAGLWNGGMPSFKTVYRQRFSLLMTVVGLGIAGYIVYANYPAPMSVHFIDVGQGDATLIVTPHGRGILIDAGGSAGPGDNSFDVGESVVVPYLRHYGVKHLDLMVLTHNHQDHAGGAAAIVELVGAAHVLAHSGGEDSSTMLRLAKAMRGKTLENPDDIKILSIDGVKLTLFRAGNEQNHVLSSSETGKTKENENERSTIVRAEYGVHSFLITGDLEGQSEQKIVADGVPPSTVLKVGHHGSKKSSGQEFLSHVAPQFAVISVGADNVFGHPAPSTIARLKEFPTTVFRTDRNGAIVFRSDGRMLRVDKTVN